VTQARRAGDGRPECVPPKARLPIRRHLQFPSIPGLSARVRILLWCSVLVAAALFASVVATRLVLLHHLSTETDSELTHELDEVRAVQQGGIDPRTGKPIADVDQLLRTALARAAPTRSEELLAISDGKVIARSPDRPLQPLERHARLVRSWASTSNPGFGTIHLPVGNVRYLAAPVTLRTSPQSGTDIFVAASFMSQGQADVNTTVGIAATVGLLALLGAIVLAWFISGRILAPVQDLEVAARSINESELSYRLPVRGDDELARLASDFNAMLDRVESAFRSQQKFLDDAGHELRTPITIVRGHLELMGGAPEEQAQVRAIIIDELDRMSRMVSDLLLLARAERPDFLQMFPIEVGVLTSDVLSKVALLGDRKWLDGGHADIRVIADGQRLTQAWMQLAQNAVQHTVVGDAIELGSRVDGGRLELWVADSGSGVPMAQREVIFQGFSRTSYTERQGEHFGLGLPIVRAIAEAHRGDVTVGSSGLGGARFTLWIPTPGAQRGDLV